MMPQILLALFICLIVAGAQESVRKNNENIVAEIQVLCNGDAILVRMNTNKPFNGMVYPRGLFNSNSCIAEYYSATNMTYRLPLKSCNTMSSEVDDGVEYFNTLVVQPHHRLLTNQGKGYHIRCKYQTRERTITNTQFNVSSSFAIQNSLSNATPVLAMGSMPTCTMKIFRSNRVAENPGASSGGSGSSSNDSVRVGDKLIMVIEIEQQDMYGMRVTNCAVRDGMNLAEQLLINEKGCPIDETIMPRFDYSLNYTRAIVAFPAHKFPHTSSIYYQCNVRLCIKEGGCQMPECHTVRNKRYVKHGETNFENRIDSEPIATASALALQNNSTMSFDVFSGLYVNDSADAEQQIEPFGDTPWLCLTRGQTSFVVLLAAIATIGAVILFTCQIGPRKSNANLQPVTRMTALSANQRVQMPTKVAIKSHHRLASPACCL